MKYIKLLFLSLSFAATFTACDMTDFGDINKDPNEPVSYTHLFTTDRFG